MAAKLTLYDCVKRGDLAKLTALLDTGLSPDELNEEGQTSLLTGAWHGHKDIVELLITRGADVNAKSKKGNTPLHASALRDKKDTVELLISHGADVNVKENKGNTPLYISAFYGHEDIVKVLISRGADVNVKNKSGNTPLHVSAAYGHKEVAEALISHRADIYVKNNKGNSPLYTSAVNGHKEIVNVLISNGADVNAEDKFGDTPLLRCASEGHKEIVKVLISHKADINVKDKCGLTPLHISARKGHKEIVEVLISYGADINVKDKCGMTPLHISAQKDHKEIVEVLISHGADVNVKDNIGKTPLHGCAHDSHIEIVKVLIRLKANVNAEDIWGRTSLHYGARNGHKEIVELLIEHGADISPVDVRDYTPLRLAEKHGHRHIVDILNQLKLVRIMGVESKVLSYRSGTSNSDDGSLITNSSWKKKEFRSYVTELCDLSTGSSRKGNIHSVTMKASKDIQGHHVQAETAASPPPPTVSTPVFSSTSATAPSPESTDEVTQLAQKLLEAVKRKDGGVVSHNQDSHSDIPHQLGGSLILIENKTVNNNYYNCHNNEQSNHEKVKLETSQEFSVRGGSTTYGILHGPEDDDNEKKDKDEYINRTVEDRQSGGERTDRQTLNGEMTDETQAGLVARAASPLPLSTTATTATTASKSTTTVTSAMELRRRIESQAGYMEKMVQSCVAGSGVCQDQNFHLAAFQKGNGDVKVNVNFIMQPKNVTVFNTRQVTCETAEVDKVDVMTVGSKCNFFNAPQPADDEGDTDSSDDNDDIEVQMEEDNK